MATAAGMTGARADNAFFDLTSIPPTLTAAPASASVITSNQLDLNATITAGNTTSVIGMPTSGTQDLEGGTDSILVDMNNNIYAVATGNDVTSAVDLYAATGSGTTSAATAAALQANVVTTAGTLGATVNGAEIRADIEDLGGGTIQVSNNLINADGTVNTATTQVAGDINPLLSSAEAGSVLVIANGIVNADATVLATTVQQITDLSTAAATVTDARIGLSATVDGTPASLAGIPLGIDNNEIRARFDGNDATNVVAIDNGGATTLLGTAGAVSGQVAAGESPFTASVTATTIEAGDFGAGAAIADLSGSDLSFTGNDILAAVATNASTNGLSLAGVNPVRVDGQSNSVILGGPLYALQSDLFIQNTQISQVDASASDQGDLSVVVEDVTGSTVDSLQNSIGATATGNTTSNHLDVTGAATFNAFVGVQSVQVAEALQTAQTGSDTDGANLLVSVASVGGTAGDIAGTAISADGNRLFSEAMGNLHDSQIDLSGTDLSPGSGGFPGSLSILRTVESFSSNADVSLLSVQDLNGGGAQATTVSNIRVDASLGSAAGSAITDSGISASENEISALAAGNLSTGAGIDIAATTYAGTAAVLNIQTVENGTLLSAETDSPYVTPDPTGQTHQAQLEVSAFPETISDTSINADANTFSARVFGNLADSTTNSLSISANTIEPFLPGSSTIIIDRTAPVTDTSSAINSQMLVNDQSVADPESAVVTASNGLVADPTEGDLVLVRVGLDAANPLAGSTFTASDNQGTVSATLNQATSTVSVDAATTLESPAGLVNVQSVADQDVTGVSTSLAVTQHDNDITVSVGAAADGSPSTVSGSTFQVNGNDLLASGRANLATNSLTVSAQTQVSTSTPVGIVGLYFGSTATTSASALTLLANDQEFRNVNGVAGPGIDVINEDSTFGLTIGAAGAFSDSVASIDGNTMTIQALGNEASNTLTLDVGVFDAADTRGLATIASNQVSLVASNVNDALSAQGLSVGAILDATDVAGSIAGSQLTIDNNAILARARTNYVVNTLTASGTTLDGTAASPTIAANQAPEMAITASGFSFTVVSQQHFDNDTVASLAGAGPATPVGMSILADGAGTIDGSAISLSDNSLIAEARANDSANALSVDYVTNEAAALLGNVQTEGEPIQLIDASVSGIELLANVDSGAATPVITDTSISLDGNGIGALASSSRSSNTLSMSGTNILSASGTPTPTTVIDPASSPLVETTAVDVALVNSQGGPFFGEGTLIDISAAANDVAVLANVATLDTGSLSIDNNAVVSQALDHSAANLLTLHASANIGAPDVTPTVSLVSTQLVADEANVSSQTTGVQLTGTIDDMSAAASASATVSLNSVASVAIGGSATNRLDVQAGASVLGGVSAPSPVLGFPDSDTITLNADNSLLNLQAAIGNGQGITSEVDQVGAGLTVSSDVNLDSLTVDNNAVQSQTRGFVATNTLTLSAGASSDTTGQLANVQAVDDFASLTASTTNVTVSTDVVGGGAVASGLSVSNNLVSASAAGNVALNGLGTSAGASLQESSGASASLTPDAAVELTTTGADYAVLNRQSVSFVDDFGATVGTVAVGIDDLSGATGVNGSALNVEGNTVLASATANDATNQLVLGTGTFQHPSAAVANLQTTSSSTISASTSGVSVGIGLGGGTIGATSNNSSLRVTGNSIGATATGNSATNTLGSQ
ncbi:MAG: hypothetical protein GC201_10380 [Alphaproteobacteria bacterium]|nr:hypothetical protein [Alphaproteobacteria bacterium]